MKMKEDEKSKEERGSYEEEKERRKDGDKILWKEIRTKERDKESKEKKRGNTYGPPSTTHLAFSVNPYKFEIPKIMKNRHGANK